VSRLDKDQNRSDVPNHRKKSNRSNETEVAIRRSLTPIGDDMLPVIREIAAADEAVRTRELVHYRRYRDLLKMETKAADEFLDHNGNSLLPMLYRHIKEALDQAKTTDSGDDVARLAANRMTGDGVPIMLAGTARALRNPAVIDHLAQLRAAERLLQLLGGLSDSPDERPS